MVNVVSKVVYSVEFLAHIRRHVSQKQWEWIIDYAWNLSHLTINIQPQCRAMELQFIRRPGSPDPKIDAKYNTVVIRNAVAARALLEHICTLLSVGTTDLLSPLERIDAARQQNLRFRDTDKDLLLHICTADCPHLMLKIQRWDVTYTERSGKGRGTYNTISVDCT